ncbi:ArnT family glycosyltransferase [Edaphobacter bradus]|uniref:ArnT family glycosyltransferase n=1 Tax=Edaphobacter bradus TaxID=2259016 RepID=UPI0021DF72F9|nr:glycosyltransferase family 39 protein [Edaphobacter bradus]
MLVRMQKRSDTRTSTSPRQTIVLVLAGLLLCVLTIQLVHVARLFSANWDEAHHLYDGYAILTRHDYRANAEVPPLVKVMAALPLLHLHPSLPGQLSTSQTQNAFLAGRAFVFGNGGDRLLFPARMACMLFSLTTALLTYAAGRTFFGALAGLCALFLFVFDPNVLAHGTLISTDMGSACFILAGVYAFYRFAIQPGWKWLLAAGLLAGLAMVAKFTGILIAPMLLVIAVAEGIRKRSAVVLGKLLAASIAILVCACLVIWMFYGFRYAPATVGLDLSPSLAPYLASMPHKSDGAKLALLARFHLLPQAYLWGLANTKHTEWEYTSYFLGRVYRHGPWQYFPLAFLIKSTLPLLILLLLAPLALRSSKQGYGRELIFLLVPVGVYFAVITTSHFDIGARHLMPVYPFLYIIAGAAAAMLLRRGSGWAALATVLVMWQIVTTMRIAPNYMAYGNEAWGGPLQVRRYLSDANVDWGQQLKTVKQYLDQNHISNCWFAYFPDGAVQPIDYGIHCKRLPTPSALWWLNLPMTVPPQIEGTVLISESVLDGVESGDGALNPYDAFHKLHPVAILQDGVYVYRGTFSVPLASALVDVRRSRELAHAGQIDQALQLAQQAATLAPDSPRVQLQLADVLAMQQQWREAADHYHLAQVALMHQRPDLQAEELGPPIELGLKNTLSSR